MEMPGDHHKVSANASSTKPARLLAIFVLDTTEKEIVIPDKLGQVCFGSLADILTSPRHVRFTSNNGSWAAHPSQHLAVGL